MTPNDETDETIKIRRTTDNTKKRPNSCNRHDPSITGNENSTELSFINPTDLEWLSLNYRKERAAKMSPSIRRMILVMFQNDYQYFPTLREIRDELIYA